MTLLHPLGLIGLIGIPILIIIYIIKTQYTEQTVTSTYLWTLSEKFLKRKNPISRVAGIISLILQLLTVAVISLAIAHPVVTVPDSAQEYCFILDGSASMNMSNGENTRIERAKDRIEELINDTVDGSVYTLVYVGEGTSTVFERLDDRKRAYSLLEDIEAAHTADSFIDACGIAQGYFDENPGVKTYLITDKEFATSNNVTVINVSDSERNFSIGDVTYVHKDGNLTVSGLVTAHGSDRPVAVDIALYIDGAENAAYSGSFLATSTPSEFQLFTSAPGFRSLRIVVESADATTLDNEIVIYNLEGESMYSTLIVSARPFFIEETFRALMESTVTVVSPEAYSADLRGYGLYIFDSVSPAELPMDGAVWFINPIGSVENAGFSYQSEVALENGDSLTLSSASSSLAKRLRADVTGSDIYISSYVKCGLYKEFTSLYTYQGNPIIFAGTNGYGNRQTVFAFDLHKSDIAITYDYSIIMRNLIEYSFPDIIEESFYTVEDTLEVNVVANCDSIRLDTPSGEVKYLDVSNAIAEYPLTEIGTYTVTVTVAGTPRVFNIYSASNEEESVTNAVAADISLVGEAGEGGFDGTYDLMTVLFIALAVLFFADWGVYCYEKHQLR